MGKVADPLREFADSITDDLDDDTYWMRDELYWFADQIDREHERRMEQCRHETKRAFAKYLRQITAEYERNHKRKSWLAQRRMQLELYVLRHERRDMEDVSPHEARRRPELFPGGG